MMSDIFAGEIFDLLNDICAGEIFDLLSDICAVGRDV